MKRLIYYFGKVLFIPVYAVIVMTSCQEVLEDYMSLTLDKVTATTATITVYNNHRPFTVFYSESEIWEGKRGFREGSVLPTEDSLNSSNNYTITDLKSGTKYYYRIEVHKGSGKIFLSEIFDFTTETVSFGELQVAPKQFDAEVSGKVIGLSDEDKESIRIGILYSDESGKVEKGEGENVIISDISAEGNFKLMLSDLFAETKYYYCGYVCHRKEDYSFDFADYIYDTQAEFATLLHPYNVPQKLTLSSATDISLLESANCYVISETGLYKFKTVKGNSNVSVGDAASAAILWETFGTLTLTTPEFCDLIKAVCYEDGYVAFQTADTFKEGNAVIAVKDAEGNILWSWHIWMTDKPDTKKYYSGNTMMDRNLGATDCYIGSDGALGLLYQWGRKDPFLGSCLTLKSMEAKSTIIWPTAVESDNTTGTIDYACSHPTTFITCWDSNGDWYYTGGDTTDDTRWTESSATKSIYDPCPAGWRVPDGGKDNVWEKEMEQSDFFCQGGGFWFGNGQWYPASGYRSRNAGSLGHVGDYGYYWSASPRSYSAYYLYFSGGSVDPSDYGSRAYGYSVRCLQE